VEDRLTSATVNSVTTTFTYNGDGLRDSLTVNSNTTTFTWDVNRSIPQVLDDEDLRYVYGIGRISQVGASTHYYLSDGLGSTMALTDEDGDVVNDYDYDVFGALRDSSGSQDNDFTFAGEQVDGSTGLQYLRARYYDMEAGRFLSREPLAKDSLWDGHPFGYAGNLPTVRVDPEGLDPIEDVFPIPSDGPPRDCPDLDEPIPVPLPPIGSHDDSECLRGYQTCRNPKSWFRLQAKKDSPNVRASDINKDCYDEFRRCQNRVFEGKPAEFKFEYVREVIDEQSKGWEFPISLPRTGSGGELTQEPSSKEGSFGVCP
jgi:RHS repeat-associated protein